MADRLIDRLAGLPGEPQRILELGCGTGYLTGMLAERFPLSEILAVDFAERMVDIARRRVSGSRIEYRVEDAEAVHLEPRSCDLIVSNATIQWLGAPFDTLPRLGDALRPDGRMIHTTFGPATFCELKGVFEDFAGQSEAVLPRVGLPLRSAEEWGTIFEQSGLVQVLSTCRVEVEHYGGPADFLRELQATGVTYRPGAWGTERLLPRALIKALDRYDARFASLDGIPVTYELLEVSGVLTA